MIDRSKVPAAARRTGKTLINTLPLIMGILALVSLAAATVPAEVVASAIPIDGAVASLIGAAAGSVAAGNPLISYVLAGEFVTAGASLAAVTAFIVSWITVGCFQLPAEAAILGTRFALWRNAVSFLLAVVIGHVVAAAVLLFS